MFGDESEPAKPSTAVDEGEGGESVAAAEVGARPAAFDFGGGGGGDSGSDEEGPSELFGMEDQLITKQDAAASAVSGVPDPDAAADDDDLDALGQCSTAQRSAVRQAKHAACR